MKTLSQVFNDEARQNGTGSPFRTLSAAGGTNVKDSTGDRRLKLLNEAGRLGKVMRRPDGTQYVTDELLAMPIDDLQVLFDRTPADSSKASQGNNPDMANVSKGTGDGTRPIALMAAVFEAENSLTLLAARRDTARESQEDAARFQIIRTFVVENRLPLKADGFSYCSQKDLLDMPMTMLRALAANTQKTVRCL